jgi:NAD(P)-dependent dehydrogenase (short-subunit alcohol dehydrogenase family)
MIDSGPAADGLHGQVALVTGAGRGIGRSLACGLAGAGAKVGLLARSAEQLEQTQQLIGAAGVSVVADVTDPDAVRAALERVTDQLGPLDLLVNNAGANSVFGPLWAADPRSWWSDVSVNLYGPFLCSAAVLPAMIERRSGRIINIVSGTAGRPFPHNSAYAASKAALVRLTDCLAAEVAEHGLAVFALGPGTVRTDMSLGLERSEDGRRWLGDAIEALDFIGPEAATAAVLYLASGAADALSGRWLDSQDDLPLVAASAEAVKAGELFQLRRTKLPAPT